MIELPASRKLRARSPRIIAKEALGQVDDERLVAHRDGGRQAVDPKILATSIAATNRKQWRSNPFVGLTDEDFTPWASEIGWMDGLLPESIVSSSAPRSSLVAGKTRMAPKRNKHRREASADGNARSQEEAGYSSAPRTRRTALDAEPAGTVCVSGSRKRVARGPSVN